MPVVYKQNTGHALILLWRIEESEQELARMAASEDVASAARFSNPSRRLEHLAWRAALRTQMPDARIAYDDAGAPYVVGVGCRIGVAHTAGMAAVMISDGARCAVDIERLDRDMSRAVSRFVGEGERGLPASGHRLFNTAVWCAKECAYKLSGRKELDLLEDIEVVCADINGGSIAVRVLDEKISLKSEIYDDCLIVYSV